MDCNSSNFNLDCNISHHNPPGQTSPKCKQGPETQQTNSANILKNPPTPSTTKSHEVQGEPSIEQLADIIMNDQPMLEIEIESSPSPPSSNSLASSSESSLLLNANHQTENKHHNNHQSSCSDGSPGSKKSVLFDTVTVYHFTRSQGFSSIPSQGGSTLGMKRRHFLRRKLSVDMFEEVRRRSRREILLKIKFDKHRPQRNNSPINLMTSTQNNPDRDNSNRHSDSNLTNCKNDSDATMQEVASTSNIYDNNSTNMDTGSSDQANPTTTNTSHPSREETQACNPSSSIISSSDTVSSDSSSDDSFSDLQDISDSELEGESCIFLQPIGVKLRRSLLRASGVCKIDPTEKLECKIIRESRERTGCNCINQCIPALCGCSLSGVNCHVDRLAYPCGCISGGCGNPFGRTEFDVKRVKGHLYKTLFKYD